MSASIQFSESGHDRPLLDPSLSGMRRIGSRAGRVVSWDQRIMPYLFILPNMLIFGVFTIYPAINGFNLSLYSSKNGRTFQWVGFRNFERIVTDNEFWQALGNTLIFVAGFVALSTVFSIIVAVLLESQKRGRSFFRAVFFVPVLLSPVVVGLLWHWMLQRQGGLLNEAIGAVGMSPVPWLAESGLAMVCVVAVGIWTHFGFYTMIVLAGLQSIDGNLYQAADLDGAGGWQKFHLVTLPLLTPTSLVVLILSTISGFQAFDFIYNFTGGGPVGGTTLMVQYIYEKAFGASPHYGLAAAGSVILFVIVLALTLVNWLIGRKNEMD